MNQTLIDFHNVLVAEIEYASQNWIESVKYNKPLDIINERYHYLKGLETAKRLFEKKVMKGASNEN